ncbi:hypothetical protein ACFLZW_05855 [Chloroflexota bacterium]
MKKIISFSLAGKILMSALILLVLLHVLILLRIVPADIVWGGQINDSGSNLVSLEIVALSVTLAFIVIVAAKLDYIKLAKYWKVINFGTWTVFAYLLLNTLGNLASGVTVENLFFAPLTLVMAFCALRLAIEK